MNLKYILFVVLLGFHTPLFAQYDNVWAFGRYAGLDFNTDPPTSIHTKLDNLPAEGSASISDVNGQLLFYTNGTTVWDRNHDTMMNGNNISGLNRNITSSTSQGTLIVPMPGSIHEYYIFSLGCSECNQLGRLSYSIVNMNDNSNLGVIDVSRKGVLVDTMLTEHMMAVAGTNCDIWLITFSRKDTAFKSFNINRNGIASVPVLSKLPNPVLPDWGGVYATGIMDISPDRKQLAIATSSRRGGLSLYDLDVNTGKLSNPLQLLSQIGCYGTAFSPDNTKLYVTVFQDTPRGHVLKQFDLSSEDSATIVNSLTSVGSDRDFSVEASVKRGPDGKMYTANNLSGLLPPNYLGVINKPDLAGRACNFVLDGLLLLTGTTSHIGLPNSSSTTFVGYSKTTTITKDTVACFGNRIQAKDTNGAYYRWNDGTEGYTKFIEKGGTYWVTYQALGTSCVEEHTDTFFIADIYRDYQITVNTREVCWLDTIQLSPKNSFATEYFWENGSNSFDRIIEKSGKYWVTYQDTQAICKMHIDTFIVEDIPMQTQSTYTENDVCWGDSAVLSPVHLNGIRYIWNDESTDMEKVVRQPGYYWVSYYDTAICTRHLDSFYVFLPNEQFHASFSIEDSIVCQNQPVRVKNTSDNYYNHFAWFWGNGDSAVLDQPEYSYPYAGSYTIMLVASRNDICNDTAWKNIVVDKQTETSFEVMPRSLCAGSTVHIQYDIYDSSLHGLSWSYGDGNSIVTNDIVLQHAYDQAGIMYITVEAIFRACPSNSYTDSVIVHPFPVINLGVDSAICMHGNPILLENLHPTHDDYEYYWSTGDTTPILKVLHSGKYSLTVTDNATGCRSLESVIVHKDCYIDIPNVFTPNGDGINDYFFPRQLLSKSIPGFYMKVFNRWGQLLFTTTNAKGRGWDGRLNGKEQPEGVYIYLIEIELEDGKKEQYNGNVTLIR